MVQVARGAGDDIIGIINEEEMDRLYGVGFTDRFIETIDRGTLIIFALEEYKKREGMYPQALDDLTPDILESIPGTTLIQHKEIRYSPYWTNNDDTPEYFEEYQKFWYYPSDDLSSFGLVFSGPNEYCNGASWSLDSRNVAETYPFICNTQSILMRLEPPKFTQRFETQEYVFYVPPDWKDSTEVFSNPFDPFEAYFLGLGEFPIRYNNSPVDVKFWMFPEEGTLEEITNGYIDGYYINPDRVFPENFQVKSKKIYLSSGEEANFVHVRFYRKSKGLNQSRFDLITVNPRDGQGYAMTLSIQYFGDYHKVEDDLKLIEFAEQLFNTFKFKS